MFCHGNSGRAVHGVGFLLVGKSAPWHLFVRSSNHRSGDVAVVCDLHNILSVLNYVIAGVRLAGNWICGSSYGGIVVRRLWISYYMDFHCF